MTPFDGNEGTNKASTEGKQGFSIGTHATLVVGLGGAGGQVVARLKRLINETYASQSRIRNLVKFLVLDADSFENLVGIPQDELVKEREFLTLTDYNPRERYRAMMNNPLEMVDMKEWFTEEYLPLIPDHHVTNGAAKTRPLGRFYFYNKRDEVRGLLLKKITECHTQDLDTPVNTALLRVLVITGCCGGTGSSCFFDLIYMLQHMLRRRGVDPQIDTVTMLPDPFIRVVGAKAPYLAKYLKANAYAFFREIDFIMKQPDQFNNFAMDVNSAKRNLEGPQSDGLRKPAACPIGIMHLIDEGVVQGGIGLFAELKDLYDYTARVMLYTHFTPDVQHAFQSEMSNLERHMLAGKDSRPMNYMATGYAELRYPSDFIEQYYQYRIIPDGVRHGLIGDIYQGYPDAVKNAVEKFVQECETQLEQPLTEQLDEAKSDAVRHLVSRGAFYSGGKIKPEMLERKELERVRAAEDTAYQMGRRQMDILFRDKIHDLRQAFQSKVETLINSLGEYQGLVFLLDTLRGINDRLETRQSDLRMQLGISVGQGHEGGYLATISACETKISGGAGSDSSLLDKIIAAKRRKDAESGLNELINAVNQKTTSRLEAHRVELHLELLKLLVGDVGNADPVPMVFVETTQTYEAGQAPIVSVLDQRIKQVTQLKLDLDAWASGHQPDREFRQYMEVVGTSPTTFLLPNIFSGELRLDQPELLEVYYANLPGLQTENDAERQRQRAVFAQKAIERLNSALNRPLTAVIEDRAWFSTLGGIMRQICREHTQADLRKNILDLLKNRPDAPQLLTNFHDNANCTCRINQELMTTEIRSRQMESSFLGAPDLDAAKQIQPRDYTHFLTTQDRLVEVRLKGIFPMRAVQALLNVEAEYYRRDPDNKPHIDRRFNDGYLDIIDEVGAGAKDPKTTFLKIYALSRYLDNDPDTRPFFEEIAKFDAQALILQDFRPTFIEVQADVHRPRYGMHSLLWAWTAEQSHYVLRPASRLCFANKPFLQRESRQERIQEYCREDQAVENHQKFLADVLEPHKGGRQILASAYQRLIDSFTRSLAELRNSIQYQTMMNTRTEQERRINPDYRVIGDNERFFVEAIERLQGLIARTEPIPVMD